MIAATQRLPQTLWKTLTWDRGMEMYNHARISVATDLEIYFCDLGKPPEHITGQGRVQASPWAGMTTTDLGGCRPSRLAMRPFVAASRDDPFS